MPVQHPANHPAVHAHAHSHSPPSASGHTTSPTQRNPTHSRGMGQPAAAQQVTGLQWSALQRLGWVLVLLSLLWAVLVGSMAVEA